MKLTDGKRAVEIIISVLNKNFFWGEDLSYDFFAADVLGCSKYDDEIYVVNSVEDCIDFANSDAKSNFFDQDTDEDFNLDITDITEEYNRDKDLYGEED